MVHSIEALGVGAQVGAYLDDTYLEQVDTRVIAVGERDGTPWAAVEHCLFHPQGGGQPADRGWLEDMEIIPVRDRESGLVVAMAPESGRPENGSLPPLAEGQKVRARIDLRDRTARLADGRRVVHLDSLHSAPCGGTHVRSLGDLAEVVLPTLKVKKGRIRVSYNATHVSYTAAHIPHTAAHVPHTATHVSYDAAPHVSGTATGRSHR